MSPAPATCFCQYCRTRLRRLCALPTYRTSPRASFMRYTPGRSGSRLRVASRAGVTPDASARGGSLGASAALGLGGRRLAAAQVEDEAAGVQAVDGSRSRYGTSRSEAVPDGPSSGPAAGQRHRRPRRRRTGDGQRGVPLVRARRPRRRRLDRRSGLGWPRTVPRRPSARPRRVATWTGVLDGHVEGGCWRCCRWRRSRCRCTLVPMREGVAAGRVTVHGPASSTTSVAVGGS